MDTDSAEFQAALRDHARSLGVDPDAESHLLSLVQEALLAELPEGWEQGETEDGTLYYFNTNTDESIWEHPLDGHYRELINQKKAQGGGKEKPPEAVVVTPNGAAKPHEAKTEVSKLEVYSFDDDSDEDVVKPASKTVQAAVNTDKSSRLSSLFDPKPAPSFSATSAELGSAPVGRDSVPTSSSTTSRPSTGGGGFGRDRSWLLDDNDDDVVDIPSLQSSRSTGFKDTETTKPTTTASSSAFSSSASFTSRLFGTANSTTSLASASSGLGSANSTGAITETNKTSPRRGIASTIKGPFFQDMPTNTSASTSHNTASAVPTNTKTSNAADTARIKELEKKNADLVKQLEQLRNECELTKPQLETAIQDAQEANYLKMKANETKTKLTEKEAEVIKAKQDTAKLQDDLKRVQEELKRVQEECTTLKQVQTSTTQQQMLDGKREVGELQARLADQERQRDSMEKTMSELRVEREKLEAQLKEVLSSLDIEKRSVDTWQEQHRQVKMDCGDLMMQLEQQKQAMNDQNRKFESIIVVQETLDRQTKYAKELEEKQKELLAKVSDSEAQEAQTVRDYKAKELEVAQLNSKVSRLRDEVETREKQVRDITLRLQQEQAAASEHEALTLQLKRNEEEFERKRQLLEREKKDLVSQLRERSEHVLSLQNQLQRAHKEQAKASSTLQMEILSLNTQLKQVRTHEVFSLEKQRDQLVLDNERFREKLLNVEKELRNCQQELATEASKNHQMQVEIEAWKRKEQQQKTQKDAYLQEKMAIEKQLQSSQAEASAYKHDKRLEIEKLAFRLRELESQVAQKDYEIVRLEEKFTKAEAWRLKESRRVEERESQLLDLKEELAQLKSRNIDAENNLIIQELRREKEQQASKIKTLTQELEEERVSRQVAAQKFQDEAENLQKAVEWQLPQLAAACVSRSSEEWTRKCHEMVSALRDEWNMKALTERNELMQRLKDVEERRDHVEQKLKNAVSECEFLRKEVHRVEDNNKVLLDQLHTIRVYMTQRAGLSGFMPTVATQPTPPQPPPAPQPQQHPPPCSPSPPSSYSDFAAVNQLNAQLAVLHAQFQQLFDAHNREPISRHTPSYYSPSDRFEIPTSPSSQPKKHRLKDPSVSSATSFSSSLNASLDQSLDSLLEQSLLDKKTNRTKEIHKEKEELLASLTLLGGEPVGASDASIAATGGPGDTMWYQKNYWRTKYTS